MSGTYDFQLNKYVRLHASTGLNFLGVFPHDHLPTHPPAGSCLIANYSNSYQQGTHWIAMMDLGTRAPCYADSYGFDPDDLRLLLSRQSRFIDYLKTHTAKGGRVHFNEIELQALEADTCGEYACKFVLDGLPMKSGVVNSKWQRYVASDSSKVNDAMIKKEIRLRNLRE